jgi:hypothetical protein
VNYLWHLRRLLSDELQVWIARALPFIIRRSLARGLHGVWRRGAWTALPAGGAVVAMNHHAWWDAYLVYLVIHRLGRRSSAVMAGEQLERFPFFRPLGAITERELRTALRRLRRGQLLFVFPEGELRPAGGVSGLRPGAAWLAERAQVPLVPLAMRVVLRGAQHPEAYLSLGPAFAAGPGATEVLERALDGLLRDLDDDLASGDPEQPVAGFEPWLFGARSGDRRAARAARWWGA